MDLNAVQVQRPERRRPTANLSANSLSHIKYLMWLQLEEYRPNYFQLGNLRTRGAFFWDRHAMCGYKSQIWAGKCNFNCCILKLAVLFVKLRQFFSAEMLQLENFIQLFFPDHKKKKKKNYYASVDNGFLSFNKLKCCAKLCKYYQPSLKIILAIYKKVFALFWQKYKDCDFTEIKICTHLNTIMNKYAVLWHLWGTTLVQLENNTVQRGCPAVHWRECGWRSSGAFSSSWTHQASSKHCLEWST